MLEETGYDISDKVDPDVFIGKIKILFSAIYMFLDNDISLV